MDAKDKKYSTEAKELESFMKSIENGDLTAMTIAAANVAAWSKSLMKGLGKLNNK
jgi:hypothetical protein